MKFLIEQSVLLQGHHYVIARQQESGSFMLTASSKLDGIPIESWFTQPRVIDQSGNPDTTIYAFVVKPTSDSQELQIGSIVELTA